MSGILKRTIFQSDEGGYIKGLDWARVDTELGTMLEPRCFNFYTTNGMQATRDATDMMTMVNAIESRSLDRPFGLLGEDITITGGNLYPRTGR